MQGPHSQVEAPCPSLSAYTQRERDVAEVYRAEVSEQGWAVMSARVLSEMTQGSEEWLEARRGLLTASEMHLILTPTLKPANNDKERQHLFELLAQRITGYVEPTYIGSDMLRGQEDEIEARLLYAKHYAPVREVGFITNNKWGFTLGYSPDALVGESGAIECKSRRQKYQMQTIVQGIVPDEYMIQLQTGLLVAELQWIDFVSYCGGMPMYVERVYPLPAFQEAIVSAAAAFEARLAERLANYQTNSARFIPTERRIEQEMHV
jgi:predicted phage-related endonuclease